MKYQPQLDKSAEPKAETQAEWTREEMALAIQRATGWTPLLPGEGEPDWRATFLAVESWCDKRGIEPMLYRRPQDQCWTAVIKDIPQCGDTPAWALVRALYAAIRADRERAQGPNLAELGFCSGFGTWRRPEEWEKVTRRIPDGAL